MQKTIERALGLNDGELRRAWPLFGYLFLTTTGTVATKAARDALFLDRFTANDLPYVDIVIALLVGATVGVYLRLGQRTNLRNLQVGSLLFFAANALAFWWMTNAGPESGVLFVVIYVWVGVFSVLAPSQVWMLANYVLTTREAKRSFGFVGSGAILGWIVGGLATRAVVSWFGTESMLVFVAIALTLSAGLVVIIWHRRPESVGTAEAMETGEGRPGGLRDSLMIVLQSPYLQSIAALVLLSAMTTTVAGWQFKAIAKSAIPDTDQLAIFFGNFNTVAGLASLGVQLFITGRVLRVAGVGTALFIVPVAMIIGSGGVLVLGTLVAVAMLKASDQVLRYSIDKATTELLYLPVSAAQTFKVKSFIDAVVYRMGDAFGGLLVLLFAAGLKLSPVHLAWVGLVLTVAWLGAAWVARKQYVENLRESIHQHRVDAEKATAPVMAREATIIISSRLKGAPDEIAYALNLFQMANDRALHPAVRGLLRHEVPEIRQKAVALLARAGDTSVKAEVEALLRDPALEVRTEALLYLTAIEPIDPLERISELGDFEDFSIRSALVSFLARPGRTQNLDAARMMLTAMVDEEGAAGVRTRLEAARLIAGVPDVFDRDLRRLLEDDDLEVAKAAIAAVGRLKKRSFVGRVLERAGEPELTAAVTEALAQMGDRIVGTLRDDLMDEDMAIGVRRQIPMALQAIGTIAAQTALSEAVVTRDVVLRYNIISALNKMAQLHAEPLANRDLIQTLLEAEIMGHYRSYQVLGTLGGSMGETSDPVIHGLRESMTKEGERIFRLLKILHPNRDMHSAYVGLRSSDPSVHDNAVEFLDTILGPVMRSRILPLFDRDVKPAQRVEAANHFLGATLHDREDAVAIMTLSDDPWLRSCAAYAIGEMRLVRFLSKVEAWSHDNDPLLRATAVDALEKLQDAGRAPA